MAPEPLDEDIVHRVRRAEVDVVWPYLGPRRILELGGADGFQAALLESRGADVEAIDVAERPLPPHEYHPVVDYDGTHFPFADGSFDRLFSSNVLEHVRDIAAVLAESRRVLKPGGLAVHLVPTAAWRAWSTVGHYPWLVRYAWRRLRAQLGSDVARTIAQRSPGSASGGARDLGSTLKKLVGLWPHGEYPNTIVEFHHYRRAQWTRLFENAGWSIVHYGTNDLFYTGMLLWPPLSIDVRTRLAHLLGAACHLFVLRPQ